jgi:preprotein translocase subunit YajC
VWWPYLVLLVVLFGLLLFGQSRRRRQVAENMVRMSQLRPGTEVMTTSGLYATVAAINGDGTVQLSVAPGVEVRWALAALRDAESLPAQYRAPMDQPDDRGDAPGELGAG